MPVDKEKEKELAARGQKMEMREGRRTASQTGRLGEEMKVVKGSDLVALFGAMHNLDEFVRFASIRSATQHALTHDVSIEDMKGLLRAWLRATESDKENSCP